MELVVDAAHSRNLPAFLERFAQRARRMLDARWGGVMVFRGRDDLRILLGAVYGMVTELRWNRELAAGDARVVVGDCRIGPLKLGDAMTLELDAAGRIRRIGPHLRPWLALTLFALMLGPKLARHPGVLIRALRTA